MSFFGMMFWVLVLWFLIRAWRRSHRWAPIGARGYPGWYGRDRYAARDIPPPAGQTEEYVDSLESRITQLEERLDFTERLLADRNR